MYSTLIVLIVIASVLLVLIVLVQNSKGGGLASDLSAGTQFGGVAEQKSKLETYTWVLVSAIVIMSIVASLTGASQRNNQQRPSSNVQNILNQTTAPSIPTTPSLNQVPAN